MGFGEHCEVSAHIHVRSSTLGLDDAAQEKVCASIYEITQLYVVVNDVGPPTHDRAARYVCRVLHKLESVEVLSSPSSRSL